MSESQTQIPRSAGSPRRGRLLAALAGVASVAAGIGAAELVALLTAPGASPIFASGSLAIDLAPQWLKETVIGLFGTADKIVIIGSVVLGAALIAALAGVLENARPPSGRVLIGALGVLTLVAALTRPGADFLAVLPPTAAVIVALPVLRALLNRLHAVPHHVLPSGSRTVRRSSSEELEGIDRRRFLVASGLAAGLGILAAVGGQLASASIRTVEAARRAFSLPKPAVAAASPESGNTFDIPGLSPLVTPNTDFYRIDTALLVPSVDPESWKLRIYGLVETEVELSFEELLDLPLEESYTTLACVSNYVGGDLIGNALWLGYPIRKLLTQAGPLAEADMVLSRSVDGFTASTPLEVLTDDRNAILAVGMNGEPLPPEHGFPVRMVVPGLFGYVSATKWVTELRVTRFADETAYWTERGWAQRGPVKLSSRIDTPATSSRLRAGQVVIAGVAWAQHTGISRVQLRVDDGAWQEADLAQAISADTWRQWMTTWNATAGHHKLTVRAFDANGITQIEKPGDVVPDGATGLHSVFVDVN
ncbi:MAG: molybdopterin-dependent oxidoreductase [Cryobacterium sp.]|nr:molybdopterin-dependent oxidoreductase [Cryobacterium sp.]MBX3089011.1 molybdopterin-dependent oxidoreductase [Cryobacterium sp.]